MQEKKPFISICIPAYNRAHYLKRLLDSIVIQTFRDFEVIVSDDSSNQDVEILCRQYSTAFRLRYLKNPRALGTPQNWNEAIRNADGDWIKIMHDDDWFAHELSLAKFADSVIKNPSCHFFFCAYANIYESDGRQEQKFVNPFQLWILRNNPVTLVANNVIGPPSTCLHKNYQKIQYDTNMKWVVDMDFYIRFLQQSNFCYVPEICVNVGINNTQVTTYTFGVPEFHLKENLYLLSKTGFECLKNIIVYDAWWRLIRNFRIVNTAQLHKSGYHGIVPKRLQAMIQFQRNISAKILNVGLLSKALMILSYVKGFI